VLPCNCNCNQSLRDGLRASLSEGVRSQSVAYRARRNAEEKNKIIAVVDLLNILFIYYFVYMYFILAKHDTKQYSHCREFVENGFVLYG
jgi:hypothetical protein